MTDEKQPKFEPSSVISMAQEKAERTVADINNSALVRIEELEVKLKDCRRALQSRGAKIVRDISELATVTTQVLHVEDVCFDAFDKIEEAIRAEQQERPSGALMMEGPPQYTPLQAGGIGVKRKIPVA